MESSSSDGSFAWTDTSSDDESSNSSIMKVDIKTHNNEEETDCEKSNKKKLQERLFNGSQNAQDEVADEFNNKRKIKEEPKTDMKVKNKIKAVKSETEINGFNCNGEDSFLSTVPAPKFEKKHKRESKSVTEMVDREVKLEEDTLDIFGELKKSDIHKKKKKIDKNTTNVDSDTHHVSYQMEIDKFSADETIFESPSKKKKKKKHTRPLQENDNDDNRDMSIENYNDREIKQEEDTLDINRELTNTDIYKRKKNKDKNTAHVDSDTYNAKYQMEIDKFSADETIFESPSKKKKKKKHTSPLQENDNDDNRDMSTETFDEREIKLEEGTLDINGELTKTVIHKKKKKKDKNTANVESDTYDAKYQIENDTFRADETNFELPANKKAKKKHTSHLKENDYDDKTDMSIETFDDREIKLEQDTLDVNGELTKSDIPRRKKKKDKNTTNVETNQIDSVKFSADETMVEPPLRKKKKKKHTSPLRDTENNDITEMSIITFAETVDNDITAEMDQSISNTINLNVKNTSRLNSTKEKQSESLSERIQFVDDEDILSSSKKSSVATPSAQYKKFINRNPFLKPCKFGINTVLNDDDELWIVNCPSDVDIQSFKDSNVSLGNKCKIKINGLTYEGKIELEDDSLPIVVHDGNSFGIKRFETKKVINLHRKIPKARFIQENVMLNNQKNFIPLPETKCRHPLFGANYKEDIKLPATVQNRLNATSLEIDHAVKKKKKPKREVKQDIDEPVTALLHEKESDKHHKKHRKRKLIEESPHKSKRAKINPESVEAWESEKTIENNLFNF